MKWIAINNAMCRQGRCWKECLTADQEMAERIKLSGPILASERALSENCQRIEALIMACPCGAVEVRDCEN